MSTPVYYGPPTGPLITPGLLVVLEGAILGGFAAYFLGDAVHDVFRILAGIAILVIYVILYRIPYVRSVVSIIVSLFYSGAAGYYTYTSMQPKVDRIWIGFAALIALAFSLVMHWEFVNELKDGK